jgi:ABC-type transporter Mla subunit MlaD
LLADPNVIRGLAGALRDRAGEIRAQADQLVGHADAVRWTDQAADAMRGRATDGAGDLRRSAALHDDAATALERHAAAVEHVEALIHQAWARVTAFVADVRSGAVTVGDDVARWVDDFVPPPAGALEWLHVDLPFGL